MYTNPKKYDILIKQNSIATGFKEKMKGTKMEITENITKQITETAYLTEENTKRYRPILRFFYEENEKMNYFL